jgi:hypothetical protein
MESLSITKGNNIESSSFDADTEDEDAAYRPMLRGIINTRCNYDESKIDEQIE